MNEIGNRIKEIRKKLGLNQTEFGEKLGLSTTTIAGYEKTGNVPEYALKLMHYEFRISRDWLLTGEGKPLEPLTDTNVDSLLEQYHCTGTAAEIIKTYLRLDESIRDLAHKQIMEAWEEIQRAKLVNTEDVILFEEMKHNYEVRLLLEPPDFHPEDYWYEDDEDGEYYD